MIYQFKKKKTPITFVSDWRRMIDATQTFLCKREPKSHARIGYKHIHRTTCAGSVVLWIFVNTKYFFFFTIISESLRYSSYVWEHPHRHTNIYYILDIKILENHKHFERNAHTLYKTLLNAPLYLIIIYVRVILLISVTRFFCGIFVHDTYICVYFKRICLILNAFKSVEKH